MIKINFKISENEEIRILSTFAKNYNNEFRSGFNLYQEMVKGFKDELSNIQGLTKEKRKQLFKKVIQKEYNDKGKEIKEKFNKYIKIWKGIEPKFIKETEKLFSHPFPGGEYTAFLTILQICPRCIETKSFQVRLNKGLEYFISTVMHEMVHFMYFDYMKKVFFNQLNEDLEWDLSEIINVILLNKPPFSKMTKDRHVAYPNHKKRYEELNKIYLKSKNMKDFIEKAIPFLKVSPEN